MSRKTEATQAVDRYVGSKIKWYRIQRGLSQDELASRLGISYQQLHKYENGTNSASAGRLADIASVLSVNVSDLFDGFGAEESPEWINDSSNREQLLLAKYYNQIKTPEGRAAVQQLVKALSGQQEA
jgi:transcriptional regulator with XRE-family HTH domain